MNLQEQYWSGKEGNAYNERNKPDDERAYHFMASIFKKLHPMQVPISAIEFGANDGRNLKALKSFGVEFTTGVEVNSEAWKKLIKVANESYCQSMLGFKGYRKWDLAFTKGCLIHINPTDLSKAYDVLYRSSSKYILIAEYYSPRFEEILYQGKMGFLWKGPYAEGMLVKFPDLRLRDYRFISKLDEWPEDDLTWFLLEKT